MAKHKLTTRVLDAYWLKVRDPTYYTSSYKPYSQSPIAADVVTDSKTHYRVGVFRDCASGNLSGDSQVAQSLRTIFKEKNIDVNGYNDDGEL